MAHLLRFALAQFDFPVGAVAANTAKVGHLLDQARKAHADLLVCPELTLCGYPPEDLLLRRRFLKACQQGLEALATHTDGGPAALVGFPHGEDAVYNAVALLRDGQVVQVVCKQMLPNYGVFDDKRYFQPGCTSRVSQLGGVCLGFLVCEDLWCSEPAMALARAGAELLVVSNASPWDDKKQITREATVRTCAKATGCAIVYLNLVGGQDDLVYDGSSLLVNGDGSFAARAPAFVDALLLADFDPMTRTLHARDWPVSKDVSSEAQLYAALVRGIADYVHKNNFSGVLLGLSGGIDSALTLTLAVDALGAERVTAVMLPTRYTSALSRHVARKQAETLGVDYHVIDMEPVVETFLMALMPAFNGKAQDSTEENLQSRIRGTTLMALSNKHGRLLLTTGNKSEMALGYCTLYGDMCGAYAPLKDLYKTTVYRLAQWRNAQHDGTAVIPVAVIERPPSAELCAGQTDQDSLPPYDELDAILGHFIERQQSQAEIIAAGFAAETVHRVVRLVLRNEFKRRQSAPGPRVTTRAFGRERRYPITSAWHGEIVMPVALEPVQDPCKRLDHGL